MKFNVKFLACIVVILTVGCGPSGPNYEERNQLREEARQESVLEANAELDAFAQRYEAVSISFSGYDTSLGSNFTAANQQELEGKVVAFRSTILDVQRTSSGVYEAIFGSRFFSSTTIHLTLSPEVANDILSSGKKYENEILVAARIERIARHQLSARVCDEPDCNTISIGVESFFPSYQIWGQMVGLRPEEPGT